MASSPLPEWKTSSKRAPRGSSRKMQGADGGEEAGGRSSRRTRRRLDDEVEVITPGANGNEGPSNQPQEPNQQQQADPQDQRQHFFQLDAHYETQIETVTLQSGGCTVEQNMHERLVQQVMRLMLFRQHKFPDVPVKQTELASLINAEYKGPRKPKLSSVIIAHAQSKFMQLLGIEMEKLNLKTARAAASSSQAEESSGPAAFVLRSRLPDDLRSVCVQPSRLAKLNHAFAVILLQLVLHSNGPMLEDEMWRLLECLGAHKGVQHPTFGSKPEEQIASMLQRRYLVEDTSSEWVGAEGNPVKAYAMGESATAELGPALSSFDDRVFSSGS